VAQRIPKGGFPDYISFHPGARTGNRRAHGVVESGKHETLAGIYELIEELRYCRESFFKL